MRKMFYISIDDNDDGNEIESITGHHIGWGKWKITAMKRIENGLEGHTEIINARSQEEAERKAERMALQYPPVFI